MNGKNERGSGATGKLWTHDFVVLLIMSFFNMFCMQLITVSVAPWVVSLGLPSSYTGLFTLCFTLPCIAGCFVWARLTRRTGRRVIILTGSLLFALCVLLMPVVAPIVGLIVLLRVLQGIGYSAVNNGMMATQADVIAPQRIGEGLSFFGIAQSLTLVIGPGAGLLLIEKAGFSSLFFTITLLGFGIFVLCLILRVKIGAKDICQSQQEEQAAEKGDARGLWLFLEKRAMFPCMLLLLCMTALGSTNFYAATYAANLGYGNASLFFVVYAIADLLAIAVVGKLSDRLPMRTLILPGMLIAALGLFWLSGVNNGTTFLLASIPIGIGTGMIVPVAQAAAFRGVERHRRGMVSATYYIAFDGGMCLGSIVWGFAIELVDFSMMYRFAAIVVIIAAAICIISGLRLKRKPSAQ